MGIRILNSSLKKNLYAIIGLNVFDAFATLTWIMQGVAIEANPLMAELIDISPLFFLTVKMGTVICGCLYLWKHRKVSIVMYASKFLFIAYSILACYHMIGFYTIIQKTLFSIGA